MQSLAGECEQSHSLTVCHGHPGDEMSGQPWVVELVLTREPGRNNTDFYYVVSQAGGQLSHSQLSLTCPVGLLHFLITLDWPGVEWSGVWTIFSRAQNKATRRRRGFIMFYPPRSKLVWAICHTTVYTRLPVTSEKFL